MAKGTMLDRLAEAIGMLNKRPRKGLTPRQRVANAQRWNNLADIGETIADRMWDTDRDEFYKVTNELERLGLDKLPKAPPEVAARYKNAPLEDSYDINRLDNPFLSDNIYKYEEQSDFLDWCLYNRVEPNGQALKQFRWETYKTLPYRERQWIANKDDMLETVGPEDPEEFRNARTLRDWDAASKEYMGSEWDMQNLPVYKSYEEFPDDFDYMWRY